MFRLTFETDNAAFEADLKSEEIARILRAIADKVEDNRDGGKVMDSNGNAVGSWEIQS